VSENLNVAEICS